ncbi:MAG TPA: TIR domain-containing protein [Thermoanaerobaculia bacterium]|nr:TIR domain-containing protein [Thermoanaerobaculia bacterium]
MNTMSTPTRRFRIALSFPGEHRPFVEQVAKHLSAAVGQNRVLYDQYYEAEFARVDLDTYLQGLYHDESELIAVFLCADYERKEWCGLEWRAVRDLIKQRQGSSVMPLRFDSTKIPGLFSTDGYIWIGDRSASDIAGLILQRLGVGTTPDPSPPIEPKWTDELRIYGEGFVGRQDELAALDRAWAEGVRIFALHAEGGAGKTRVVVEWLRQMRDDGWRGARRVFVHSFYSQGSDERRNASSELFFEQALAYLGYRGAPITQAYEKGRTLARLLVEHHGLLVLDGLEPLQHPTQHAERGRLKDPGIALLLLALASVAPSGPRGLCLITSRQPVVELQERTGATVLQQSLDHLHRDDGAALLRQFQVAGPDEELKTASDEFHGHAYSLMLLGSYLKTATDHHDIRRRREVVLLEDPEYGSHARHMFAAYVRHLGEHSPEVAVLRLLGFFDCAAEKQLLDVLRAREGVVYEWSEEAEEADRRPQLKRVEDSMADVTAPLLGLGQTLPTRGWIYRLINPLVRWLRDRRPSAVMGEEEWLRVLNRLRQLRLIDLSGTEKSPVLDAPLLRECFAELVRAQFPAAWRAGHRRLFEHLGGTAPYWPEGLEALQPLYQAVAHGCLAGLHEQALADVYHARILRGTGADGFYSSRKLGTIGANLGAVAYFFTMPWTTLAPNLKPANQAWLLSQAAFYLRALGRLSEAVEPMQAGLAMRVEQEVWVSAAIIACNLSELELTRGEVAAAVTAGEQSVAYADRSGDAFQQMSKRTALADALHQAGRRDESRRLFENAESRQAADQPEYPRLYSLQGFQYCDLLLSEMERAVWQRWLDAEIAPTEMLPATTAACDAVSERASQTLAWAERHLGLLDVALDHLTLARAELYKGQPARNHVDAAIDGLRAAGTIDELPRGLLTRAWQRCLLGDEAGSRADLDEAWEIAERGPMPLHQADIQLTRARLFRDRAALAEARRLIEKHGYHRRDGELADAEAAAVG